MRSETGNCTMVGSQVSRGWETKGCNDVFVAVTLDQSKRRRQATEAKIRGES